MEIAHICSAGLTRFGSEDKLGLGFYTLLSDNLQRYFKHRMLSIQSLCFSGTCGTSLPLLHLDLVHNSTLQWKPFTHKLDRSGI